MIANDGTDYELGKRFLALGADRDMTLEQLAGLVKRRRQWASILKHRIDQGKGIHFQFATRNRIIKLLGGYHDASDIAGDGGSVRG